MSPAYAKQKFPVPRRRGPRVKDRLAIPPECFTVLEPFVGGGTPAVAALETGRKCVAVELSKEYARLTMERAKRCLPETPA